jgi:hypothetical protein
MDRQAKERELDELRANVRALERELAKEEQVWPPRKYYTAYHVLAGFVLGMFGATTSLIFNIVGSLLVGQHPLQLIRVYLTFPLGEAALQTDDNLVLAIGCCLYLATGMALGIPFHYVLSRWLADSTFSTRLVLVSVLGLAVWLVNYYALLSWIQPLLFGGDWIVREIPGWVAAVTHLVFGWTMLLVHPLGLFVPYRVQWGNSDAG